MSLREALFRYRGYTPIPFLLVMVVFARPTPLSLAIGMIGVILGESLRFWGVAYAGPLTRVTGSVGAPELVVAGPFAFVRNPLYLGNMVMYVGVGVMANALVPWLVIAAAVYFYFQYAMIVSLEEEFLFKTFEEEYGVYTAAVPRFLPAFRSFKSVRATAHAPDWKGGIRSERRTLQAVGLVVAVLLVRWWVG
jgi:protein-S-isoprenylcysteine O-methyltransferase Ste14